MYFTINLTQGEGSSSVNLSLISWLFEEKLTFSTYQHCQNQFAIKQRRKSVDLSPKPCFWASKQLFAIDFLLATCNVCPLTIPEFFAQTRVSDYWQLIHWTPLSPIISKQFEKRTQMVWLVKVAELSWRSMSNGNPRIKSVSNTALANSLLLHALHVFSANHLAMPWLFSGFPGSFV